jgi:hypothetical protein
LFKYVDKDAEGGIPGNEMTQHKNFSDCVFKEHQEVERRYWDFNP